MVDKSIVVILSGGLDSSTMLWYLQSKGYNIKEILTFNYGQRHSKEVQNAKLIVRAFSKRFGFVDHEIVDISNIGQLISKGSLTGDEEVPHETYDTTSQRVTIVPNRNMIFLSIAAGRAISLDTNLIGYAAHASDYSVYPDCRPEFIEQMNKTLHEGNLWNPVKLIAPFVNMSKVEVVSHGIRLDVPFEYTWSCYEGLAEPCMECGTCLERTEAFVKNNISDPAISTYNWDKAVRLYEKHVLKS